MGRFVDVVRGVAFHKRGTGRGKGEGGKVVGYLPYQDSGSTSSFDG